MQSSFGLFRLDDFPLSHELLDGEHRVGRGSSCHEFIEHGFPKNLSGEDAFVGWVMLFGEGRFVDHGIVLLR